MPIDQTVLVGERVAWLGSGSGLPQPATVRWIGRIPEITQGWTVGVELDLAMPVGGIDGTWRKRKLFSCGPKRGLLVPIDKIMKESSLLKTRHSLGENFYGDGPKKQSVQSRAIIKQLSLPQSTTSHEFIAKVLPPSDDTRRPQAQPKEIAANFKQSVNLIQKKTVSQDPALVNDLNKSTAPSSKPLTVENVKAFDVQVRAKNDLQRKKTLEELEKFKKHLDEWEKIKNSSHESKSRRRKAADNPESLYNLAESKTESEKALFLRIIGEKTKTSNEILRPQPVRGVTKATDGSLFKSPKEKRKEIVDTVILEESFSETNDSKPVSSDRVAHLKKTDLSLSVTTVKHSDTDQKKTHEISHENLKKSPAFEPKIKYATTGVIESNEESTAHLVEEGKREIFAGEDIENNSCVECGTWSVPSVLTSQAVVPESVSGPTPTIRKKRQTPPVPAPRRRSSDGLSRHEDDETTSVLYEPAFLTEYMQTAQTPTMTDVRGTFRRIDEDEIDRFPSHLARRPLTASISVPDSSRKGFFSFLKWFRKNKPKDDLDLDDFNAPSIAGSPLFSRSRLGNATSVDTLYSIATVSSFAFVSGAQYQSSFGSDKRRKRRAPLPPPQRRDKADSSLPSTLESRSNKQLHRRSVSESYKDRRSGAFAHVYGKRKAPAPPVAPPRERLYPSLSSVEDDTLNRRKRPAPLPPVKPIVPDVEPSISENISGPLISRPEDKIEVEIQSVPDLENKNETLNKEITPVPDDQVVCNDTLRLEKGVLRANKVILPPSSLNHTPIKLAPTSPVSPRPWYKRKSLEKRKEKLSDDWMPEVGIPRPLASPEINPLKFNFFSRGEDKKKDDKRKSGLSLLANISELDRQAAEICKNDEAHKLRLLADDDAKFYAVPETPPLPAPEPDVPKRNSTKELISMFNSIGNVTTLNSNSLPRISDGVSEKLPVAKCDQQEIKTAAVVETKCLVPELEPEPSRAQALFELRAQRQHSPSPSISTIAEISEPSSSAATLNQYAEAVWKCTRCTLENLNWKNRCDACSSCKPDYKPKRMSERRRSEMELEIDWELELQKYFPPKIPSPKTDQVSSKLVLSKTGDVLIETENDPRPQERELKQGKDEKEKETCDPKEGDIDEIRKKRLAFFMKSIYQESTSLRDAASKKSLDEAEKLKLKEMLKEMKNSLPKYEAAKNKSRPACEALPDVTQNNIKPSTSQLETKPLIFPHHETNQGAIRKIRSEVGKPAEALLVTTTTVLEDIIVRKKPSTKPSEPMISIPVLNFSTVGLKNGETHTSLKKARRVGDGPFELMRARDLATIIESKSGSSYPTHVYSNCPPITKESDTDVSTSSNDTNSNGSELSRLASQLTRASGVAEFRAALGGSSADTLAVNRLLRRLEAAIAAGRHDQAATLARELANQKVSCSVTRQRPSLSPSPTPIVLDLYVEDKVSHQGPIPLRVHCSMTVSDLKMKVQADLDIPCHVQRWILGKQLAAEDFRTLEELGVTMDKCPVFLYLVAPEPEPIAKQITASAPEEELGAVGGVVEKPAPLGKGWYFNYEKDRYSFCESDSDDTERSSPVKTSLTKAGNDNRTKNGGLENQRVFEKPQAQFSPMVPDLVTSSVGKREKVSKTAMSDRIELQILEAGEVQKPKGNPKQKKPPLKSSFSLPEAVDVPPQTLQEKKESEGVAGASKTASQSKADSRPRSRSIFDLIKPQSSDTLKKDLKVISVNAVKETIEKLTRRNEDVQRNGWRCEDCTLINECGRARCAVCTAPRPLGYVSPVQSAAEEELRRLRRNMDVKLPKMEEDADNAHYLELVGLDSADLVRNKEPFECSICLMPQSVADGVVLRECLHTFCQRCLAMTVEHNEEAEVKCPYRDDKYSCESVLQQREIKALVPAHVFEQHLNRGVQQAENRMGNAFHCKTPDCGGWCVLDDNVNEFTCPVCSKVNCLTCHAVHQGMNCRTYQDRLRASSDTNMESRRTRTMLEEMVQKGDAMACPTCQVVLMKKWGCDWLRCSMCKTEICWVTRGPRWGPNGKGDTSAGCQCGVNGVKCHPKCNYCH